MAEFDRAADATLDDVRGIYNQRGEEYADSWALSNQQCPLVKLVLRTVRPDLDDPTPEQLRLLIIAALVDVKDSRLVGPYKRDTMVDGIAYRAAFTQFMEEYLCHSSHSESSKSPTAGSATYWPNSPLTMVV